MKRSKPASEEEAGHAALALPITGGHPLLVSPIVEGSHAMLRSAQEKCDENDLAPGHDCCAVCAGDLPEEEEEHVVCTKCERGE